MSSISQGENISVQIPGLNNQILKGTIDFVNPEMNPGTRVNLVRVTIPNTNNLLHPGMPVHIIVSNKEHNSITLPAEAILTDSKG
jgi:Cu(I)/Ag(I) efflux system membrane fusion protein